MKETKTLLLATANPTKLPELRCLVEGLAMTLVTPQDLGLSLEVSEEGSTHLENALSKAVAFSRASGTLALASDGGLVVPALGDTWNSLRTHRFAGEVDDVIKAQELLRQMKAYTGEERGIFWREAATVAEAGKPIASWEVEGSHGLLVEEMDPSLMVPGFWVAGLWYFPQVGKTYGELVEAERQRVNDHWTQLQALVQGFFKGFLGLKSP